MPIHRIWSGSIRRQLMFGVAMVHAVMMTFFVYDLVERQRGFLHEQGVAQAVSLVETLAGNSTSWVLSSDFLGLEELLESLHNYPDLRYAMVLNPEGRVLAHPDRAIVGQYVNDEISLRLLAAALEVQTLVDTPLVIDVAAPIQRAGRLIGWARISLGQERNREGLALVTREGLLYTLFAIIAGAIIAFMMSRGLTNGLYNLLQVTEATRRGRRDRRADTHRQDEVGRVALGLNQMLDRLIDEESQLRHTGAALVRLNEELEERVEARTAELAESNLHLAAARDVAEAANRAKSVFLANMSHELRTPLNAILGFAQLMRNDPGLDEGQRQNLAIINHSGEHLLTLINDVLEISRIEAGRTPLNPHPFDLLHMIDGVAEMMGLRARTKGLIFEVRFDPDVPRQICADEAKLRQILINLITNAIKFTDRGEVQVEVTLLPSAPGDGMQAAFTVTDTGIGIPPEEQERIFAPFQQTAAGQSKGEGAGLGLTISREYAQLMGGELSLHSTPGAGSVFRLILPLEEAAGMSATDAPPARRVRGLAAGQAAIRVLVVEDQADNRRLLHELLTRTGFTVREASNGLEAIASFQDFRPDVVLMDIRMPILDGLEATRRIRALPEGRRVRILALTASAFREERGEILEAGCDDMLTKPVQEDRLFDRIGELLHLHFDYEPVTAPRNEALPSPEILGAAPRELVAALLSAAEGLETERVQEILARIHDFDPASADWMHALLNNFNFQAIVDLCEASLSKPDVA